MRVNLCAHIVVGQMRFNVLVFAKNSAKHVIKANYTTTTNLQRTNSSEYHISEANVCSTQCNPVFITATSVRK